MRSTRFLLLLAAAALALPTAATAQLEPGGTVDLEFVRSSTDKEKRDFSKETDAFLASAVREVRGLVAEAERKQDTVLLECLNEKLGALRGLEQVVENSRAGVDSAVASGFSDDAETQFRNVVIARSQAERIAAEARVCIGDLDGAAPGQTRVNWTYSGPEEDEIENAFDRGGETVRPPGVSPF